MAAWLNRVLLLADFLAEWNSVKSTGKSLNNCRSRQASSIQKINDKIKFRDFWMPFTPSMTYEEARNTRKSQDSLFSPFMTLAFELKEAFKNSIPGAQHPADKTVRPQMLKREDNPQYYDLIEAFKRKADRDGSST